jgi:hypothetical protein
MKVSLMNDRSAVSATAVSNRHRFQFSLRALFLFSFMFTVFCAGIFSTFDPVRYVALLLHETFWFYVVLTWAIYGRGYFRTFGIGASISFVFPWGVTGFLWIFLAVVCIQDSGTVFSYLFQSKTLEDGLAYFWPSIVAFVIFFDAFFIGGIMVLARWMIDRSRRKAEAELPMIERPTPCEAASG